MATSGRERDERPVPGARSERGGLTLPEITPWSTQDHAPCLWGEGGESTSGPHPPVPTTHSHVPPRSPPHLGELSTEAALAVTLACCPAEICGGEGGGKEARADGSSRKGERLGKEGERTVRQGRPEPDGKQETNRSWFSDSEREGRRGAGPPLPYLSGRARTPEPG